MDIISVLQLFGGIGLFLYGMSLMSSSLNKLTGSGLERILETVTTSKKKTADKRTLALVRIVATGFLTFAIA